MVAHVSPPSGVVVVSTVTPTDGICDDENGRFDERVLNCKKHACTSVIVDIHRLFGRQSYCRDIARSKVSPCLSDAPRGLQATASGAFQYRKKLFESPYPYPVLQTFEYKLKLYKYFCFFEHFLVLIRFRKFSDQHNTISTD